MQNSCAALSANNKTKQGGIRSSRQIPGATRDSSYKENLDLIAAGKKMSLDRYLSIPTFIRLGIDIKL